MLLTDDGPPQTVLATEWPENLLVTSGIGEPAMSRGWIVAWFILSGRIPEDTIADPYRSVAACLGINARHHGAPVDPPIAAPDTEGSP